MIDSSKVILVDKNIVFFLISPYAKILKDDTAATIQVIVAGLIYPRRSFLLCYARNPIRLTNVSIYYVSND